MAPGNVHESAGDGATVSLSFLRAHLPWVRHRMGVRFNFLARTNRDLLFGLDPPLFHASGYSGGAAYAGRCTNMSSQHRRTHA